MKKILCKVLVLALVLCMVLPQTVMAATYNYLEVSIVDTTDTTKTVSETSAKFNPDTAKIAELFAAAISAKYDDGTFATVFAGSGLDDTMYAGIQAYADEVGGSDGAWAAYVDATYTADSDLKTIVRDADATIAEMTIDQAYTMDYLTYTVTATRKTHSTGGGGSVGGGAVVTPPAAEEEKCACADYADVAKTAWYHTAVCAAVEKGIMKGVAEGEFAPEAKLTRAQLMTMLAREAGVDTEGGNPWYAKGMEWAVEQGISDGSAPEADITREQLVTMLYRAAKNEGKSVVAASDLANFSDAADVSDWALDAVKWAAATGVMKGSDGALNPQGTATRAEVAQFFANYAALA